jgi:hypothetical protein
MKSNGCRIPVLVLLVVLTINLRLATAVAQGTAFTYQGRLNSGDAPANGSYDLTFTLYTTNLTGIAIAGPVTNSAVGVSNGLFTTAVDFGDFFIGTSNWLQIAVSPHRANAFITLAPRQWLTPAPYAIFAEAAGGLPGLAVQANASGAPDLIGGAPVNSVASGVVGATIGGGGATNYYGLVYSNVVTGDFGTVGGGDVNTAANGATVAGGQVNVASGSYAAIAGGLQNMASGGESAVIGGSLNLAAGYGSTVGGGYANDILAGGTYAFIGGGSFNTNSGYGGAIGGGLDNSIPIYQDFYAAIGGGLGNQAGSPGAFVGGGGFDGFQEEGNAASGAAAVVGGGLGNTAGPESYATVGGGLQNTASGVDAVVAGGYLNLASAEGAAVAGGEGNSATSFDAFVAGGEDNVAGGQYSFAAGIYARALHDDSFVWADGESGTPGYASDRPSQFKIQAAGGVQMDVSGSSGLHPAALYVNSTSGNGVGVWVAQNSTDATAVFTASGTGDIIKGFSGSSGGNLAFEVVNNGTVYSKGVALTSDRNAKENFVPVSPVEVLAKVAALPISQWNYKTDSTDQKHLGPMAQDFQAAFGLNGGDDKHISVVDEGGVALAAIQGLNEKVDSGTRTAETQIGQLQTENAELKAQVTDLRSQLDGLQQAFTRLALNQNLAPKEEIARGPKR